MAVLSNPKYELFAQERAKGQTRIKAYELAGYAPDDGNAAKLEAKPEVLARIQELTKKAADLTVKKIAVDRAWVLEKLVKNVERAMQEEEIVTKDGRTGEFEYNGSVANRALELLGKEVGMFVDRQQVTNISVDGMSDEELFEILMAIRASSPTTPPVSRKVKRPEGTAH